MTITEMLSQSITLTLLGMGVVFSFLIILIGVLALIKRLVIALKLDVEESSTPVSAASAAPQSNSAVIAAIAAALKEKQK